MRVWVESAIFVFGDGSGEEYGLLNRPSGALSVITLEANVLNGDCGTDVVALMTGDLGTSMGARCGCAATGERGEGAFGGETTGGGGATGDLGGGVAGVERGEAAGTG